MMRNSMTIAGQIERLVAGLDGAAICDDCITDQLNLSVRTQANVVTRSIAGHEGFSRVRDCCSSCGSTKTVICRPPGS